MAKAASRRLTRWDVIILISIGGVFTLGYFGFLLPFILSSTEQPALRTFDFTQNEWFDARNVKIIDNFRVLDPTVANNELFYEINYQNKKPFEIAIEPELQIMYGGRIVDTFTADRVVLLPNGIGNHKIRFFTNHTGENQVILNARVINTTDSSRLAVIPTTYNIPIYSIEASVQKGQNLIALYGVIISIGVALITTYGLIISLSLSRRQADALKEQIELIKKQMMIQHAQSRPLLVLTDISCTVKDEGQKVRFFARIQNNGKIAATDVTIHGKEVTSEKIEDLIKEKSQILSNSTELGTVVPRASRDYVLLLDWKKGKETTFLALWLEYTFLESEKDENLVVMKVAGGWTQNDISQRRYTYEELRETEAKSQ